jgi:hypothetical protein
MRMVMVVVANRGGRCFAKHRGWESTCMIVGHGDAMPTC